MNHNKFALSHIYVSVHFVKMILMMGGQVILYLICNETNQAKLLWSWHKYIICDFDKYCILNIACMCAKYQCIFYKLNKRRDYNIHHCTMAILESLPNDGYEYDWAEASVMCP